MYEINCFNKTTMQMMSVIDPAALVASDPTTFMADPDLNVIDTVPSKYWKVESDTLLEMTQAEKDVVDGVSLPDDKTAKKYAVDVRTVVLIHGGCAYDGRTFSMSDHAQKNWNRLHNKKLAGKVTYPYVTVDLVDVLYELADEPALVAFFDALDAHIEGHLTSGRALKVSMDAATTKVELDAVVDPR